MKPVEFPRQNLRKVDEIAEPETGNQDSTCVILPIGSCYTFLPTALAITTGVHVAVLRPHLTTIIGMVSIRRAVLDF